MILTRKIQLIINSDEPAFIKETYVSLYRWQRICFQAANTIFTQLFVQENIKELLYLSDGTVAKLADSTKSENGILNTSRLNSTQRLLSARYKGQIPIHILGSLALTLTNHFDNEKKAYREGTRTIRNYKKDIPIPFPGADFQKLQPTADGKSYHFKLFRVPFRMYLGHSSQDKKMLLEKVLDGKAKIRTSSIQLEKEKIFLLAAIDVENEKRELDANIVTEAWLSPDYPLIVKVDKKRYTIGTKEEFLYRRLAIQAAYQRVQKGVATNRSQHGRKRKKKPLLHYRNKERDYVNHKLHLYSRQLIELCLKHNSGTLFLVDQTEKEEIAKCDSFVLRNWNFYTFRQKIAYKAERVGITLVVE